MQQLNEAKHRNRDHKAIHTMKVNSQTSVWYRALLSGRQGHIEGTPKGNTVCCLFEGLEVLQSLKLLGKVVEAPRSHLNAAVGPVVRGVSSDPGNHDGRLW